MLKKIVMLLMLVFVRDSHANASGAGTCIVDANYASITGMPLRPRNLSQGSYTVTSNLSEYIPGEVVELTLAGPTFTGLMFTVVDENGNNVGTFEPEANFVHECMGSSPPASAVTHLSDFGNLTSYTLFWIPPSQDVGTVYVLGYVLKGERFNTAFQEFFRFVRDDNSALSIISGILFSNGFE